MTTATATDGAVQPPVASNGHPAPAAAPEQVPPVQPGPDPFDNPTGEPGPGGELAVAQGGELSAPTDAPETVEADWPHARLNFMGDELGIRKPTQQALAGFSLASSKYVRMETKNDITGLFIARHLSPVSYGRVFSRLMDPDDTAYTVDTIGELMKAVVMAAVEGTA